MEEQLYKKFIVISCIFVLFSLVTIVLFMLGQKGIGRISAFTGDNSAKYVQREKESVQNQDEAQEKAVSNSLVISLPKDIVPEDVTAESIYVDQTVMVTIAGKWDDFYEQKMPKGNQEYVKAVYYNTTDDSTRIYIELNEMCEHQMQFIDREIRFTFIPVHELYDKIVVIDAGCGKEVRGNSAYGVDEKDITLDVARELMRRFEETDIKAFYTRTADENPSYEKRAGLANSAQADLFISIHVNADENTRTTTGITTSYMRGVTGAKLSNQELALLLQSHTIKNSEAYDRGTEELQVENEMLKGVQVPAAMIEIGYVTNKQEALKMSSVAYKESVANGIVAAVTEAFEVIGNE